MGIEEFPSAPPQQPGKRAKQPPPAGWQVGILIKTHKAFLSLLYIIILLATFLRRS